MIASLRHSFFIVLFISGLSSAYAQEHWNRFASNVIMPQRQVFAQRNVQRVQIERIHADVTIQDQHARTCIDIFLRNPHSRQLEAEVLLPIPPLATVKGLDFKGAGSEPSARLLTREEARKTYDSIVNQLRDPALLEFIDFQLLRSSVFPVPAHGTQQIRISYESILTADGDRIDYILPRSQSNDYQIPWTIKVQLQSKKDIATAYSPSHDFDVKILNPKQQQLLISKKVLEAPGSFQLSFLRHGTSEAISYFAYPDPSINGGYVLVLAASKAPSPKQRMPRCIQLVIDRSGSMHSGKIDQVKQACLQILAGLNDNEWINITTYNEYVHSFAEKPIQINAASRIKLRAYIENMRPQGGTNIHDALYTGLSQETPKDTLPLMLFLTDGIPTIGKTNEKTIRDLAHNANPNKYRIFSVGVGVDVNTPLLQELADRSRAKASFLQPHVQLELAISSLFAKLNAPTMTDLNIEIRDESGNAAPERVADLLPNPLPDLFKNDQLLCVARYQGNQPFIMNIKNKQNIPMQCIIDPKKASVQHAHVARIWATHHIAVLLDAIRDSGIDPQQARNDPKTKELIEEVIRLSLQFGVLTEYTAFFAREGTPLHAPADLFGAVQRKIEQRAFGSRSGKGSYNQDLNLKRARESYKLNNDNRYVDENLNEIRISNVQTVKDTALYNKSNTWIDSSLVQQEGKFEVDEKVHFGSKRHLEIARELAKSGRQGMLANSGAIVIRYEDSNIEIHAP